MAHFTTALVPALLGMLEERGVPSAKVLRELELPEACRTSADEPVTATAVRRLTDLAERAMEDPFVGVHAAERVARGTYGLAEFITRSASTLGDALEGFARYSRLLNEHFQIQLERRGEAMAVEQRFVGLRGDPGRQQHEFVLAVVVLIGRQVLQRAWSPEAVWFSHARPAETSELERFFGTTKVEFGQRANGFLAGAEALRWPIRSADPALHRVLALQADKELEHTPAPDDLPGQVRAAIREQLQEGAPRIEAVASRLGLTARTLQRRLADEQLVFQTLANELRADAARELLRQKAMPLAEVAFRLGYTNLGAFIRAFKGWTGQTPGEFRTALDG